MQCDLKRVFEDGNRTGRKLEERQKRGGKGGKKGRRCAAKNYLLSFVPAFFQLFINYILY